MQSENVKLAKIQANKEVLAKILDLINNPVFAVVLAFVLIEWLQKVKYNDEPLMGNNVGTMLEAAMVATPVLTALANSKAFSDLIKTGGTAVGEAAKLAPLLAMAA